MFGRGKLNGEHDMNLSSSSSYSHFNSSSLDVDRSISSLTWHESESLSREHVEDALEKSKDGGATLVLMKLRLEDIGEDGAEALASIGTENDDETSRIERISLANNRLATLPMAFALLSKLRYLSLKHNNFTSFPEVLSLIPSLDTLDLSCNEITELPHEPGDLVNLRVFCLSKNKLLRLPAYLARFRKLAVLEIDRNPIEWPPRSVLDRPVKFSAPNHMQDWIQRVQKWISTPPADADDDSLYTPWSHMLPSSKREEDSAAHSRSFSVDSNLSISSIAESDFEAPPTSSTHLPMKLHLGILGSSGEVSPTDSIESYLPSPAESEVFLDKGVPKSDSSDLTGDRSSSITIHTNDIQSQIPGKQSIPDLRTARFDFLTRPVQDNNEPYTPSSSSSSPEKKLDTFSIPSPLSQRQDSGSSAASDPRPTQSKEPLSSDELPVPTVSITSERNSYFRRMSCLPTSRITNTLPTSLLRLVDSARSLLFAVSQIYQSLEHYAIQAIDDRLSSVLRKVLDPANADMLQLIRALDHFDTTSKQSPPQPQVCRAVVESCRDTVAVFGKAVSVLSLQLKVIATEDDVRYLRSLLLTLYGASAEIALAWQNMLPHIEGIKAFIYPSKPLRTRSPNGLSEQANNHIEGSSRATSGPPRTARRHAGSFSSKDVELGKDLPSYDEPHLPSRRIVPGSRKLRSRQPQQMAQALSGSALMSPLSDAPQLSHSRSESYASMHASSSSSSSSPSIPSKPTFLELPSTSKTQVDKVALGAVQEAVDIAPVVWNMIEDLLGNVLDRDDLRTSLENGREVTSRLSQTIRALRNGDHSADRRGLRADAHVFLKTVVHLSNALKKYGGTPSSQLRAHMVKLTNSTEEFAILLHVSSFSPTLSSNNARPFSPTLGSQIPQPGFALATRGAIPMSRSRSAQPPSSPLISVPPRDGARSANLLNSSHAPQMPLLRQRVQDSDDPG